MPCIILRRGDPVLKPFVNSNKFQSYSADPSPARQAFRKDQSLFRWNLGRRNPNLQVTDYLFNGPGLGPLYAKSAKPASNAVRIVINKTDGTVLCHLRI